MKLALRTLLRRRHMTAYRVARAAGVSLNTIYRLTSGRATRIELGTIDRLCRALRCRPGDLFNYTPR